MFKLNLPLQKTQIITPLVAVFIATLFYFLNDNLAPLLEYHRDFIKAGEFWRAMTGHFLHSNGYHLLLNLGGLTLLWLVHGDHYRWQSYSMLFIYSGLICSAALYMFYPEMKIYVGLSGILHGVFVWGAVKDIQSGLKSGYALLAGVAIKIAYEHIVGASVEVTELINARVAIEAHLWGALGGLFFAAKEQMAALKAKH